MVLELTAVLELALVPCKGLASEEDPAKTDDAPKANEERNKFWNERPCSCKVNYFRH